MNRQQSPPPLSLACGLGPLENEKAMLECVSLQHLCWWARKSTWNANFEGMTKADSTRILKEQKGTAV